MLPSHTQRFILLAAILVGTPTWWWLAGRMPPGDGLSGWSLTDSGPGLWVGVALVLLGALPALAAAGFAAGAGNPISAVWAMALAGLIANHSNSFIDVARRAADHGQAARLFNSLIFEVIVGTAALAISFATLQAISHWWAKRIPKRLRTTHLGGEVNLLCVNSVALGAGLITAAVGWVLTTALVRSGDPEQVVGGLVLAFTIAALVGHAVAPNHRPLPTLLAPAVVAIAGYLWAQRSLGLADNPDALLTAWYARDFPAAARGLPLHYLTAGVLGCTIGLGVGQVFEKTKRSVA
ncbi:MAG: hypothetical protein AAGH99_05240 [Planctomycetota bacterium]